jgi:hypothetical protein
MTTISNIYRIVNENDIDTIIGENKYKLVVLSVCPNDLKYYELLRITFLTLSKKYDVNIFLLVGKDKCVLTSGKYLSSLTEEIPKPHIDFYFSEQKIGTINLERREVFDMEKKQYDVNAFKTKHLSIISKTIEQINEKINKELEKTKEEPKTTEQENVLIEEKKEIPNPELLPSRQQEELRKKALEAMAETWMKKALMYQLEDLEIRKEIREAEEKEDEQRKRNIRLK